MLQNETLLRYQHASDPSLPNKLLQNSVASNRLQSPWVRKCRGSPGSPPLEEERAGCTLQSFCGGESRSQAHSTALGGVHRWTEASVPH